MSSFSVLSGLADHDKQRSYYYGKERKRQQNRKQTSKQTCNQANHQTQH